MSSQSNPLMAPLFQPLTELLQARLNMIGNPCEDEWLPSWRTEMSRAASELKQLLNTWNQLPPGYRSWSRPQGRTQRIMSRLGMGWVTSFQTPHQM